MPRRPSRAAASSTLGDQLLAPGDRALQLALAHPRAAFDFQLAGVVVELFPRAAPRAAARQPAAAAARRGASGRAARAIARFARAGLFLVDRAGGDLLGPSLGAAGSPLALLYDLVLPGCC